ncbi:hypothetical protein D3C77_298390 [compost metagenome]
MFQRTDHACQGRFDIQQRAGDIHQHPVIGCTLALGQALQHQHLIDDHPSGLTKAEHSQGVGNLPQGREQGLQVVQTLTVTAHEQVQALLGPHQVLTQRSHHRTQGITIGAGLQALA